MRCFPPSLDIDAMSSPDKRIARGNMAKPYQVDQFLDIVEEFGLTIVE